LEKYLEQLYFAYGSNLHREKMKFRCPDSVPVSNAVLEGYRLTFRGNYLGGGVADILPCEGDCIQGALYKISYSDLAHLDKYEVYPTLYKRYEVDVVNEHGETIKAFVYRMNPEFAAAPPSEEYFQTIIQGFHDWNIDTEKLLKTRALFERRCKK
jgi:gamma-glutamylcyclotransferase (GGCT)/AIG2-like uncharacterized protein YtfP